MGFARVSFGENDHNGSFNCRIAALFEPVGVLSNACTAACSSLTAANEDGGGHSPPAPRPPEWRHVASVASVASSDESTTSKKNVEVALTCEWQLVLL